MAAKFLSTIMNSLASLLTGSNPSTARLSVDAQPTSYESNEQFKIFQRMESLSNNDQLVFKFEAENAVNIMIRSINLSSGGREYLVYPDDGNVTFTGTLSSVPVLTVNGNFQDSGLSAHPTSGVTLSKATGAGIFSSTSEPVDGDLAIAPEIGNGSNARQTGGGSTNPNMSGVAAGQTFWLVFNHVGANDPTSGQFKLQFEERFGG